METQERVINIYIEDEIKTSYLNYAMSVIVGRAIPDIRDGLKPVHRRILYGMHELSLYYNRSYKKSARIVGEVLGKYHPHGDTAVYDSLVRMAQDFSLRYPLVQGQGNFGSIDGDSAAAMRYTEARLEKISSEFLNDLEKETVKFVPNFDETLKEPTVLPSIVPNILINGSSGIAVGMATNIPPHNLKEICEAIIKIIEDPEIKTSKLLKYVTAPDFPTGGIIYGKSELKNIYETGRGKLILRAKAYLEKLKNGKDCIIVSEIPYQVNKTTLLEKIADLINSGKIDGISDLRDESDRDGTRIVIELKKAVIPKVILNKLYKFTQLQTTFGVIMLSLVNNEPKVLGLKDICAHFIDFRKEVIVRRTKFELRKAEERAHILEGFKIVIANIDEVVKIIKKSKSPDDAQKSLMKQFKLSEIQSKTVLLMQLQRLTNIEVKKIDDEYTELLKKIEYYKSILNSEKMVMELIKKEMNYLIDTYGGPRRTEVMESEGEFKIEDLIADENVVITISHTGYIKRMPVSAYKVQKRGGRGVYGMGTKEDDFVEHLFVASTHQYILFFTNEGKCYWLKVYDIPEGSRVSKGKAIVNLLEISSNEKITAFVPVREFEENKFLFFCTKQGAVKRVELPAFSNPRRGGIIAVNLKNKDELCEVRLTDSSNEIIIATKNGLAIRFHESKIRAMGRAAAGVRGINLRKDDYVVGMVIVRASSSLLTITENGIGKRTLLTEYRITNRGGKGVINIKVGEKTGKVITVKEVVDDSELMIVTKKGIVIRTSVNEIRQSGRNTMGVKIIKLDSSDKVIDVAPIAVNDEKNEDDEKNANNI